jgi:hypothetical protein
LNVLRNSATPTFSLSRPISAGIFIFSPKIRGFLYY